MKSEHVSVVVGAPVERVYAIARDPQNLPRWAAGLASSDVKRDGDILVAASPMGEVRVRFVTDNIWGVLDHDVELPDGSVVHNPMRVMPHPQGSEVIFTLRQLAMSDDDFGRDVGMVREDLARLRRLVEETWQ